MTSSAIGDDETSLVGCNRLLWPPQKSGGRWIVIVPASIVSHFGISPLNTTTREDIGELIHLDSLRFGTGRGILQLSLS